MRHFNVGGVCDPRMHYMIDPESRLPGARQLVERRGYFVVHAPRQTGKTTSLQAFARALTAEGSFAALHFSCEAGQPAGDDYAAAELALLRAIRSAASADLPADLQPPDPWPDAPPLTRLGSALSAWAVACPLPLVLMFDEIDALRGKSLETTLRQLRAGHPSRPEHFPSSVVLCGMRDVRDYKAASGGDPSRLASSSPFNVLVESMRMGNFTRDEVAALYAQHTADTGQPFGDDAVERAWVLTAGQPWLVNALGREIVDKMGITDAITAEHVEAARERLVLARATHLDSLVARLSEDRVRRVLEPVVAGTNPAADPYDDDYAYVRDLGLIDDSVVPTVANPIYREVIVRVLALNAERAMPLEPRSFVQPNGRLDLHRVLVEFADFWRANGDVLAGRMPWQEVAAQLVLMAWLQRVVNGGGTVDREYGIGRGRIDLLVRWPLPDGSLQHEALELKVWAPGRPDPLAQGLVQLDGYLARMGLDDGVLVLFDRRDDAAPIEERTVFSEDRTAAGRRVTVLRA